MDSNGKKVYNLLAGFVGHDPVTDRTGNDKRDNLQLAADMLALAKGDTCYVVYDDGIIGAWYGAIGKYTLPDDAMATLLGTVDCHDFDSVIDDVCKFITLSSDNW